MNRRVVTGLSSGLVLSFAVAAAALAHPLGNFTINHYSGIRVSLTGLLIDHVTDFAEIPTFAERRTMDTNGDGDVSDSESAAYARQACGALAPELVLTEGSQSVALSLTQLGIGFPMGQGSPTMRLVCVYSAALRAALSATSGFSFVDQSYPERRGWREIVIQGDGTTLTASDAPATGTSDRLTHYPADLLTVPLGQATATFTAVPGGPILQPFSVPDASPLTPTVVEDQQPVALPAQPASVPASVTDLGSDVTSLFNAPDLTPPIIAFSLLVAVVLGALHAVSPGHGKTVMAAYLVGSRGNARHAIGLGLTVTVSHTLGVLALGLLSLSASALIPPERLYPILSIGSGAIVVAIGGYLLFTRIRAWRRSTAGEHDHDAHGHDAHGHAEQPEGWHEHDGIGHTHLPPTTAPMGRRGLFALGLSGGMIPSVSALLVLIGSISIGRPIWGIVLTVAFGLGMASVLVGVGLALVYARRFVERLPAATPLRLSQRLPVLTAAVVLIAGVLISAQGLAMLG